MDLADIRKKGLKSKDAAQDAAGRGAPQSAPELPVAPPEPVAPSSAAPDEPAAAPQEGGERAEATPEVGLVTFYLGSEGYAVSVEEVQEVVPPAVIVPIPRARREIAGLFSLRGAMIPLFRIRTMLELPGDAVAPEQAAKFLVVLRDDFPAALPIDRLGQVLAVRESSIKPPPPFLKGIRGEYLRGITDIQGQVYGILNLARILPAAAQSKEKGKEKERE